MTREHTYYCRRDGCDSHQTSTANPPLAGWLLVIERTGPSQPHNDESDFCSWDCVMQHAATFPPPEVIELGGGG